MEGSPAKKRKLDHPSGGFAFAEASEELLQDVKVDYGKTFAGVDETLRQFKDVIEAIESHEPRPIGDVSAKFEKANKITIPYPEPRPGKDSPYKLSFSTPAQVNVVGSYQLRTMVKSQPDMGIDMIVVMPAALFQEKDYLNHRYFYKRAYYLACITAAIRKAVGSLMDLVFEDLHGDDLLPILVARHKTPAKSTQSETAKHSIRVIPCAPEGLFPSSKLLPTSNAIRQGALAETEGSHAPTPFYNATLRAESRFSSYLRLLNSTAKSCPAYKDACVLGRIWLQQRGFGGSISGGGFGHFEWAVLVALLLQGGGRKGEPVLSASLSGSQIFRATIQYLTHTNFGKGATVVGTKPSDPNTLRQNGAILYDSARELNVLWKMTRCSAAFLQQQAQWSYEGLKDDSLDQFDALFIVKVDQPRQIFDLLVKMPLPATSRDVKHADHCGAAWDFSQKVYQTIKRAMGNRAQLVNVQLPPPSARAISSVTSRSDPGNVLVGIILSSERAYDRMNRGPSAEEKEEAIKFREFWGEKSDLRRFGNGEIRESIDWGEDTSMSIPEQIIRYVSKRHLNLVGEDLTFYGASFAPISHITHSDTQIYAAARTAFEGLKKDIRELEDLPLQVRDIEEVSPELRFASSRLPAPGKRPTRPMDVVISFEQSGKWADNLAAIQRLKIAFLLRIGSSLEESKAEVKTYLGLEGTERDTDNLAYLDVVYDEGFAFRLRFQSDAEERKLEEQMRNKTLDRHVQLEAASLHAECRRRYKLLPLHNAIISKRCTELPAFSPSMRLVKHWFNTQKLASHFSEELIEIFVLQAFLKPFPWQTPSSAMTGFLRTMQFLARWEWNDEPLIIDYSNGSKEKHSGVEGAAYELSPAISAADRTAILTRFKESRRQDPNLNRTVLFVATSHDHSGTAYTRNGPSKVVANHMTNLARAVCRLVREKGIDLDPRFLFQPSLRHYGVIIRLNSKLLKSVLKDDGSKHSHFRNLDERNNSTIQPLPEHPARSFLAQLKEVYKIPLVFFPGGEDDPLVGALWNPELGRRTRKVDMPGAFKPVDGRGGDGELEVDRQAMLAEIARIGGDLIERIEEVQH